MCALGVPGGQFGHVMATCLTMLPFGAITKTLAAPAVAPLVLKPNVVGVDVAIGTDSDAFDRTKMPLGCALLGGAPPATPLRLPGMSCSRVTWRPSSATVSQ